MRLLSRLSLCRRVRWIRTQLRRSALRNRHRSCPKTQASPSLFCTFIQIGRISTFTLGLQDRVRPIFKLSLDGATYEIWITKRELIMSKTSRTALPRLNMKPRTTQGYFHTNWMTVSTETVNSPADKISNPTLPEGIFLSRQILTQHEYSETNSDEALTLMAARIMLGA